MKNFKWISLIAMLLVLVVVGCSDGHADERGDEGAAMTTSDEVVLEVFNIKVEVRDQLEDLVLRYEELHPHVRINVHTIGGGSDSGAALQARFASGNEPSIFMFGGMADAILWEDTLLDISETLAGEAAIEGTLDGATVDGVPLGLPYNIEGFAWLINLDIFERAGIDATEIQSFEDFEVAVRQLDQMKDELGIDAVFAFSGSEYWVVSQFSSHFMSHAYHNDLRLIAEATTLDLQQTEIMMQAYIDLVTEFSVQPMITVDYGMAMEDLFVNNRVAMTHQGNWVVPTLDGIDPTFGAERLGMIPMFIANEGETASIAAGPSWFWGINGNQDDPVIEEAVNFLNWMYTSEEGKERMMVDFGFIPAYTGNDTLLIADPLSRQIYEFLAAGDSTPWVHNSYPVGFSSNTLFSQWQRYVVNELTWDEMMQNLKEAWEEIR